MGVRLCEEETEGRKLLLRMDDKVDRAVQFSRRAVLCGEPCSIMDVATAFMDATLETQSWPLLSL